MSRHKKKNGRHDDRGEPKKRWHDALEPQTKKSIFAVLAFVASGIMLLAYWGRAGVLGGYLFSFLTILIGRAYFLAPITFALIGFSLILSFQRRLYGASVIGGAFFFAATLGLVDLLFQHKSGGAIGGLVNAPLFKIFDFWGSAIVEGGVAVAGFLMMLNLPLFRQHSSKNEEETAATEAVSRGPVKDVAEGLKELVDHIRNAALSSVPEKEASAEVKVAVPDVAPSSSPPAEVTREEQKESFIDAHPKKMKLSSAYKRPPLGLFNDDRGTPSSGDIRANANIIRRTLQNFGIDVEMGEVSVGPTVTQYTLKPAEGVKLSRIVALHNDLALALAAHPIRIEAPIPGKSLVGIEIPNRSIALVGLRSLFDHPMYQESPAPLLFALGRDVSGAPVYGNLARMPHLLVAGSTGSGKSVAIHSLLVSFCYRNSPEVMKLILVDPKRVELSIYSGIPHLLTPPITDSKKTIAALRWAVKEMERRYDMLSQVGARDIVSFNTQVLAHNRERGDIMPYLVIVIDELADLMASFPREVESSVIRLAQMARAVGIHLIVSTQRPSVEVITGLIKANITSRIAFQVASQVDSRTILDMSGAEKLLGNGDMLFLAGDTAKPRRIQGGFVSEPEVKRVVEFLKEQGGEDAETEEEIFSTREGLADHEGPNFDEFENNSDDPLYNEAHELVVQAGKASASYLQRRLKVGYARAARLLDMMEERGVIGPGDGAKPREVLAGREDAV